MTDLVVDPSIEVEGSFPVLPLRDAIIYPGMVVPLFVGRVQSINALDHAVNNNSKILLITQKDSLQDVPTWDSLHDHGTVCTVVQMLRLADGTLKILVDGLYRAKVNKKKTDKNFFSADTTSIEDEIIEDEKEWKTFRHALKSQFEHYLKLNKKVSSDLLLTVDEIMDQSRFVDTIAANVNIKLSKKLDLLATSDIKTRISNLMIEIESEIELLQTDKKIRLNVKKHVDKKQREIFIREYMDELKKELAEINPNESYLNFEEEFENLKDLINKVNMPKDVHEKAMQELNRLKQMSPISPDANLTKTYLEWLTHLPWKSEKLPSISIKKAEKFLNEDHFGLEKIKEQITEYLAVQKRTKKNIGSIICLVGPPGVGKTSLAQSIAKATGRKYIRVALGGVKDEAEIRGHRKTYIGAMPGKIIQKISKAKSKNPLFLLDEIDKVSQDFRGDPYSALLEVLDPEQNHCFSDHYLEVDYDLSEVMFVATANSLNMPSPLLDRMEIIRVSGYTEDEKLNIALKHLIPKRLEKNGLKSNELEFTSDSVINIIRYYTLEAGVRTLDRLIDKICRKKVKELLIKSKNALYEPTLNSDSLEKYLGVKQYFFGVKDSQDRIGQVTGLAWTEVGGDILTLEAAALPGKGNIVLTGKLGDVMKESIQAALTVVKQRALIHGIESNYFEKHDFHVHVPEGATPKDGPSAGIGMCTALLSAILKEPVKCNFAMTGEITLRGEVLPIGGLKEKLLAAKRAGIDSVIIPEKNQHELTEIPQNILEGLTIYRVRWVDEVLNLAISLKTAKKTVDEQVHILV